MNRILGVISLCVCASACTLLASDQNDAKSRLIVMADMGNEPDEVQQMMHLLIYANEVDIEGLIACSGKYLHADRTDGRTETHPELFHQLVVFKGRSVPVWRFRRAMFNDFQARMDWCVKSFDDANHHPVAAVNGDTGDAIIRLEANPGQSVTLDASDSSDPDGDGFRLAWWDYPEAGTLKGDLVISNASGESVTFSVPEDAAGSEMHVILEIIDDNPIVSLHDYRRVMIAVEAPRFRRD